MKFKRYCYLLYLLVSFLVEVYAVEDNVLLVHSYHSGYLWTDSINDGIESVFANRSDISLHIEYLDSKRQFDENYKQLIYRLIAYKFRKHQYDLIITSDNNAFDLISSFRNTLFPTTPILFCGLNNISEKQIESYKNISGVNEKADIQGTIELIYKLQPNVNNIVIIADDTVTGKTLQKDIKDIKERHPEWRLELIHDISMEDLLFELRSLDKSSAILLTVFFRDKLGDFYEYDVATPLITSNTSAPVYALWDFNLNQGVVGGLVVDGAKHGIMAAEQALEVLNGRDINDIPIIYDTPTSLILDHPISTEFNLQTQNVKGITYINRPERLWNQYRLQIIIIVVIITLLSLAIYGLTYSLIISKRSKREYHSLVNNIPGVTYRCLFNKNYTMLIVGNGIGEITGYSSDEFLSGVITLTNLIVESDKKVIREIINNAVLNRIPYTIEYQLTDRSGNNHWIQERGRGIFSDRGTLLYLDGLLLDITHQKEVEKDLEHYREHLEQLVEERTRYLSDAQDHIIKSAKMSSLALLVSGVAHEINTPTGICLTSVSYLEDEVKSLIQSIKVDNKDEIYIISMLEKFLKTINLSLKNINRINSVVENFKQMSVDQNNEDPRYFNITQYFNSLFKELYSGESFKDLSIKLNSADELIIYSHPGVLTQILNYLIENSLEHAYNDNFTMNKIISITIKKLDDEIIITYRDNGMGIPGENVSKIFEPFYTTLRHKGHHGLGLNIVYNLILKKLDGDIIYEPDNGFIISFKPADPNP